MANWRCGKYPIAAELPPPDSPNKPPYRNAAAPRFVALNPLSVASTSGPRHGQAGLIADIRF